MSTLYIFVTSNRPDQYLNPIVHCLENGTRNVVLVKVEETNSEEVALNLLKSNVYDLLQNLAHGNYKYYLKPDAGKVVNLDGIRYDTAIPSEAQKLSHMQSRYALWLGDNVEWNIKRIKYSKLRQYLASLSKKNILIDVTAVSKVYISDILACALLEGIEHVHTFELLTAPNYEEPWRTLLHDLLTEEKSAGNELRQKRLYEYPNLVETPIFKEGSKSILVKTTPLLFSIVGTVLFVCITLVASFIFGFGSILMQAVGTVGTVLGIISFFLLYFPVRGK